MDGKKIEMLMKMEGGTIYSYKGENYVKIAKSKNMRDANELFVNLKTGEIKHFSFLLND